MYLSNSIHNLLCKLLLKPPKIYEISNPIRNETQKMSYSQQQVNFAIQLYNCTSNKLPVNYLSRWLLLHFNNLVILQFNH